MLGILIVYLLIFYFVFFKSLKIVNQSEAYIIERLGRYHRTAYAGLQFITPFLDKIAAKVDLREHIIDIPPIPVRTNDDKKINIEAVIFFQITDPLRFYYDNPLDDHKDIMTFFNVTFTNKFSSVIDYIIHKKNFEDIRPYNYALLSNEIKKEFETDEHGYIVDFSKYGYKINRIEIKEINY